MDSLDLDRDADAIVARVLEYGRLEDVRWLLQRIRSISRAAVPSDVISVTSREPSVNLSRTKVSSWPEQIPSYEL